MAFRTDISVDWSTSPRIITVETPSVVVSIQDLYDTCKELEQQSNNLTFAHLIDAAGKEELGSGVLVGITAELQNSVVAFEPRTISDSAGTATANDATGELLTDGLATFMSDGIIAGDSIFNITDESVTSIIEVISETDIRHYPLLDGTANDWGIGDSYKIWNKIQCEISGGNLVGIDSVGDPASPILPTAFTHIIRTGSSSATLQGVDDVAGAVWDEVLTGASHNITNSAGKRLRDLASQVVHTDTAQGPAVNGNQIELALSASSVDGSYDPSLIFIRDGTGVGQSRNILQYEGSTRIATVDRNWKVNPDSSSEYVILANAGREHVNEGLAQSGTSTTITLNALASSQDDVYLNQTIFIRSGLGDDQIGIIIAYDGSTKIATIDGNWAIIPDSTSAYVMLPSHDNVATEQFVAYEGAITIDVAAGSAGTAYPIGTALSPVNSLADAKVLGAKFGIDRMHIENVLIIGAGEIVDNLVFEGTNALTDVIVLTPGCSTKNVVFKNMTVTGTPDGGIFAEKCALASLFLIGSDDDPSLLFECILIEGSFSLRAGLTTPQNIQFVECVAGVGSGTGTIMDFNGSTSRVALRKYSGNLTFQNFTGAQTAVIDSDQADLTFDASCTTGTAIIRGSSVDLTDNSTSPFSIIYSAGNPTNVAASVWNAAADDFLIADSFGDRIDTILAKIGSLFGL